MTKTLVLPDTSERNELYQSLLPQITALTDSENDLIANLANTSAALFSSFDWLWVGFYLVKDDELVLGPFQGPLACTRIGYRKGVCGSAWAQAKTLIVEDVAQFDGHIACSSESRSEIVIPILKAQQCVGVLDIDSRQLADFSIIDAQALEPLCEHLSKFFPN